MFVSEITRFVRSRKQEQKRALVLYDASDTRLLVSILGNVPAQRLQPYACYFEGVDVFSVLIRSTSYCALYRQATTPPCRRAWPGRSMAGAHADHRGHIWSPVQTISCRCVVTLHCVARDMHVHVFTGGSLEVLREDADDVPELRPMPLTCDLDVVNITDKTEEVPSCPYIT